MSRLRLLFAWLLMAAVPLQGFAAVSMLFCGTEQAARVSQAGHDHSAHGHATSDVAKPDTGYGTGSGAGAGAKADQGPQGHGCPTCASCCHVVAVGGFAAIPQTTAAPSVEPSAPLVRVATRPTPVPDKPPRA